MQVVFLIAAKLIALTLSIVSFSMTARVILALLGIDEGKFYAFLFFITEPFIIPVRFFLVKFNLLQNSPIDWSFTISYMLIYLVQMTLPII